MNLSMEDVTRNLEYLEHHGVKGQKWGVRRTPEQLGHMLQKKNARHYGKYKKAISNISKIQGTKSMDQLTPKERKRMAEMAEKAQKALEKVHANEEKFKPKIEKAESQVEKAKEKQAAYEAKQEAKAQKEQEDNLAKKEKILKSQNWEEAYANKNLFTESELNQIATRVNTEKRLKEALNKGDGLDKLTSKLKSAASAVGAGYDLYNKVSDVKKIFDDGKKEKAYKEIRELMAEGKTADVIKRSIDISDEDISKFDARRKLLQQFNKELSASEKQKNTTANEDSTQKDDTAKDIIKELSDKRKQAAKEQIKQEQKALKEQAKTEQKALKEQTKKEKKEQKQWKTIIDNVLNEEVVVPSYNTKEEVRKTVLFPTVTDSSRSSYSGALSDNYQTVIGDANWDSTRRNIITNMPLVLNDIGDFTLAELKLDSARSGSKNISWQ